MLKLKLTACIDAHKDVVWDVLSKVEDVDLWVEPIISAHCENNQSKGVGIVRTCNLKGNITINEKWIEWNEGHSFTYVGYNIPMVKTAKNTWSVEAINGKTLLTTESEVVLKGGYFGMLAEPLMRLVSKKMGADSLAAFKYLVETGKPFAGRISSLPRVPVSC